MGFFSRLREKFRSSDVDDILREGTEEGYVELGTSDESKAKIVVRPFVIEEFEHIKPILDVLREGHTIALVNIKPLKDKDIIELKRAINKLKKTTDAVEGDIAGFGEDWIAAVPSFARIYRTKEKEQEARKEQAAEVTEYGEED